MTDDDSSHDPAGTDPQELREALARLDPAASITPADPARTARLVEDAMNAPDETDPTQTRTPLLVAIAAAVVLVASLTAFSVLRGPTDDVPAASGSASPSATATDAATGDTSGTVTLTLPPVTTARCAMPTAVGLDLAAVAVAGTVESISDGTATVSVQETYRGEPASTLQVQAPSADFAARLAAVQLQVGGQYLLAGTDDGRLMVCGYSGADDTALRALYAQAFGQ